MEQRVKTDTPTENLQPMSLKFVDQMTTSLQATTAQEPEWLPQNINKLREKAFDKRPVTDNTVENRAKENLEILIGVAAEKVYWQTLQEKSRELKEHKTELDWIVIKDLKTIENNNGSLPEQVVDKINESSRQATISTFKLNLTGLPNGFDFNYGHTENRTAVHTTDKYADLDNVNSYSVFDRDLSTAAKRTFQIGGTFAVLTACSPQSPQTVELTPPPAITREVESTTEAIDPVTSGEFDYIENEEEIRQLVSSLPSDKPDNNGSVEAFRIKVGDQIFNSVVYELGGESALNPTAITVTEGGQTFNVIQNVAMYTQFKGSTGDAWTRLTLVPTIINGEIKVIRWLNEPQAFSGQQVQLSLDTPVLAYTYPDIESQPLQYFPLTEPGFIDGWDGKTSISLTIVDRVPGALKVEAKLAATDPVGGTPEAPQTNEGRMAIEVVEENREAINLFYAKAFWGMNEEKILDHFQKLGLPVTDEQSFYAFLQENNYTLPPSKDGKTKFIHFKESDEMHKLAPAISTELPVVIAPQFEVYTPDMDPINIQGTGWVEYNRDAAVYKDKEAETSSRAAITVIEQNGTYQVVMRLHRLNPDYDLLAKKLDKDDPATEQKLKQQADLVFRMLLAYSKAYVYPQGELYKLATDIDHWAGLNNVLDITEGIDRAWFSDFFEVADSPLLNTIPSNELPSQVIKY